MEYRQGGRLDMLPTRINQLPLPPDTGRYKGPFDSTAETLSTLRACFIFTFH